MRVLLEGLLIVGGSLALFAFAYNGWLRLRRQQRRADFRDRRDEDAWLDDQLAKRKRKE